MICTGTSTSLTTIRPTPGVEGQRGSAVGLGALVGTVNNWGPPAMVGGTVVVGPGIVVGNVVVFGVEGDVVLVVVVVVVTGIVVVVVLVVVVGGVFTVIEPGTYVTTQPLAVPPEHVVG